MPPAIDDGSIVVSRFHSEQLEANSMKALRKFALAVALISFAAVGCSDPLGIDGAQEDGSGKSNGDVVEIDIRTDEGDGPGGGPSFP